MIKMRLKEVDKLDFSILWEPGTFLIERHVNVADGYSEKQFAYARNDGTLWVIPIELLDVVQAGMTAIAGPHLTQGPSLEPAPIESPVGSDSVNELKGIISACMKALKIE